MAAKIHPIPAFGRLIRDKKGELMDIVEDSACTPEQKLIDEVNVGIQVMRGDIMWDALKRVRNDNPKHEYYLTGVVKVIHDGAGNITESDVSLAAASNAIIIGFNVKVDPLAKSTADREKVDIRLYKVIYQAIEDVEAAMKGMLDPVFEEKIIGHAVVRQIFKASAIGNIAGSFVLDGVITRGCKCRIFRKDERTGKDNQIFDGQLASLKRFKDDVKEVREGYECGLVFEKFNDLQEDDTIEAYEMVEVSRA